MRTAGSHSGGRRRLALVLSVAALGLFVAGQPAVATHPVVKHGEALAFGYYTEVSLFGGAPIRLGHGQSTGTHWARASDDTASPSATCLESGRGATADDPDSTWDGDRDPGDGSWAVYGPAVLFGGISPQDAPDIPSGPLTASTHCRPGAAGHVTASSAVTLMPPMSVYAPLPFGGGRPHPGGVGPGPFVAEHVRSTCTMTAEGVRGETTIVNGRIARHDQAVDHDEAVVPVPTAPQPNTVIEGHVHLSTGDHDRFRMVLNEQTLNPDGSFTVAAAHMYLLGPFAVGDMVIASSTCGPIARVSRARRSRPEPRSWAPGVISEQWPTRPRGASSAGSSASSAAPSPFAPRPRPDGRPPPPGHSW
jgi:hypothetical protein